MSMMRNQNIVLVVDDDPGMLRGVKRLLREHGYDSILFPSAEASQNHDDFEEAVCIIMDINLKDESGIELRRRLEAAGILVPVIYITGNDNPAVRKTALKAVPARPSENLIAKLRVLREVEPEPMVREIAATTFDRVSGGQASG